MPCTSMVWPQLFETIMLICFGVSWPFSILKMWRTKRVEGKCSIFLSCVFVGYIAGVTAKLWRAKILGCCPEWVTVLYAFNGMLVFIDLMLYVKYSKVNQPA